MPERRQSGSLDLYSDGKHSGANDSEADEDLAKWAAKHASKAPVTRSSPNKNAAIVA